MNTRIVMLNFVLAKSISFPFLSSNNNNNNKVDADPHYDVIESLNLGDISSRRQSRKQQQPEDTSYLSSSGDHLASDRSRDRRGGGGGGGALENGDSSFHATPREMDSPSSFNHQKRDLPPPPIPATQLVDNHFHRNGSSRASSHRSSCASDEMIGAPTTTMITTTASILNPDSARRNSSKIPFSTPEYHQMSPSSQGSGGIAHQSPTTHQSPTASAILPPPNTSLLGSPGSELVSLNQFLNECNDSSRNSEDAELDGTNDEEEGRRRASSVAHEAYSSDFKQDCTKGLSYYRYQGVPMREIYNVRIIKQVRLP